MGWYFIPRVLSALLTVIAMMVLTRILGPAEYGLYNVSIVSGTVAFTMLGGWLTASISRFHSDASLSPPAIPQLFAAGLIVALGVLPLFAAVGLALMPQHASLIGPAAFFTLCHGLHEVGLVALRVNRKGRVFAALALLRPVAGVALALLFVGADGGYRGALIGMSLGAFLAGVPAILLVERMSGLVRPRPRQTIGFLRFGLPLAFVSSRSMVTLLLTQYLLGWQIGLAAVGVFAAANTVAARVIGMPMNSVMQANSADIFSAWEREGETAMRLALNRLASFLIFISVPFGVLLTFSPNVVARALFDSTFAAGVLPLLPGLAIAALLNGMQGGYLAAIFMVSKRTGAQLMVTLSSLILHGLLSWVFIAAFGLSGAVMATVASAFFGLVAYYAVARALRPIPLPWAELGNGLIGVAILVPFAVFAQNAASPFAIILLLLAGFAAYFAAMAARGMAAATLTLQAVMRATGRHGSPPAA